MTLTLPIKPGKTYRTHGGAVVRTGPLSAVKTLPLYTSDVTGLPPGLSVNSDNGRLSGFRHDASDYDLAEGPLAEAHPHAALMAEYAKDAAETAEPWLRWQRTARADCDAGWVDMVCHPGWDADHQYRRKPNTIRIGDRDVPAPLRVPPPVGTTVYVVNLSASDLWSEFAWLEGTDPVQVRLLRRGLLHSSKNDAIAHSKALLQP